LSLVACRKVDRVASTPLFFGDLKFWGSRLPLAPIAPRSLRPCVLACTHVRDRVRVPILQTYEYRLLVAIGQALLPRTSCLMPHALMILRRFFDLETDLRKRTPVIQRSAHTTFSHVVSNRKQNTILREGKQDTILLHQSAECPLSSERTTSWSPVKR
jgi:hypothetical protein